MVKPVKTPLVGRSTLQIICTFLGALPTLQPQLLKTFFFPTVCFWFHIQRSVGSTDYMFLVIQTVPVAVLRHWFHH